MLILCMNTSYFQITPRCYWEGAAWARHAAREAGKVAAVHSSGSQAATPQPDTCLGLLQPLAEGGQTTTELRSVSSQP